MNNQPIGSTVNFKAQCPSFVYPMPLAKVNKPTTERLITACIYALNELKHPHPNKDNKQITIDYIELALKEAGGVEE